MNRKAINIFLWVMTILGAVARIIRLGAASLTEAEAGLAISALKSSEALTPVVSAVYQNITHAFFFIFTDTNFLARLLIAAAGVFLIFAPFLFVKQLGEDRALIWAFLVAVSPLAAASAKQINTMTLVLALAVVLYWTVLNEKKIAAGLVFGGLVFSGPEFWPLLGAGLAIWFLNTAKIFSTDFRAKVKALFADQEQRYRFLVGLAVGVMIFGTGAFQNPSGLSSSVNSVAALWESYTKITPLGLLLNATAIFIYEPLLVLGVILSLFFKTKQDDSKSLIVFLALLWIVLILRTENLLGLSAVVFGLAFLVSTPLSEILAVDLEFPKESAVMAVFALVVFVFAGFNLLSSLTVGLPQDQVTARVVIAVFSILLMALSAGLVAAGWTRQIAASGTVIGLLIFGFLLNTTAFSKATGLNAQPSWELWQFSDPAINADGLVGPIDRVNKWNHRGAMDTKVEIVGERSDALWWALRAYDTREISDMKLSKGGAPFVVTSKDIDLDLLQGDYRGQNSVWSINAAVASFQPFTFARWLVFRNTPLDKQQLILWTNSDQFVDFQNQTAE